MNKKSAIKTSLFAAEEREQKLDRKGDLLLTLEKHVKFAALAAEIDRIAPRPSDKQGGPVAIPDGADGAGIGAATPVQPVGRSLGVPVA